MAKQNSQNKNHRCSMPVELIYELFASMPLEKAFGLLARMPNGLLARNVRLMLKNIKEAMKSNKWNERDCGPNLAISENGLILTHTGLDGLNCARAKLPIFLCNFGNKKPHIAFYFEVQFLKSANWLGDIGFCDKNFPLLGKRLGDWKNSIGIWSKYGMHIEKIFFRFRCSERDFEKGDTIGIGLLVNSPVYANIECFATCNGQLLGLVELPEKFAAMRLFPAATLRNKEISMNANFGGNNEKWLFNFNQLV